MFSLLLILSAAFAAPTDCPASAADLSATTDDAVLAFATLDEAGFEQATAKARRQLDCLTDVLTPAQAASFHRLIALEAFFNGREEDALNNFKASIALVPEYRLSSRIAPPGGALAQLYERAKGSPQAVDREAFDLSEGITTFVDGTPRRDKPIGLPSVFQMEVDGELVHSTRLEKGADFVVPAKWRDVPAPTPPVVNMDLEPVTPPVQAKKKKRSTPWWIAAGLTAGTAATLYGVSYSSRKKFDQSPTEQTMRTTNATLIGSVGVGVVAVGFTGVALATTF